MLHEKLTESDVKKIQEEIEHRKLVIRKEALESVKEARAHGDLSENFEYKAAKQYKNKNESRIRYLEKMLKNAEIIEDHAGSDEVGLNKVVRIYIPEDEEEEEYKIVKKKVYTAKPMTPEDAVLQMNLLGHNFYIFCNVCCTFKFLRTICAV